MDTYAGFVCGGPAAFIATLMSNPLDVVKSRLQLQGEVMSHSASNHYRGVLHATRVISYTEGISALQKGLKPALYFNVVMNTFRFGCYGALQNIFEATDPSSNHFVSKGMAFGMISGSIAGVVSSPFQLVKVQYHSRNTVGNSVKIGHQHNLRGLFGTLGDIYQHGGIRGIFRGAGTQSFRIGIATAVQFISYDYSKSLVVNTGFLTDGMIAHLVSSTFSSFVTALCFTPIDVVSVRLYNQEATGSGVGTSRVPRGARGWYSGPVDCLIKTARDEGVTGLYRGFNASFIRIAFHSGAMFVMIEKLKPWYYAECGLV